MPDIIPELGAKDAMCQRAGKALADVIQEALDSDGRVMDTLATAMQASGAIQSMMAQAKTEGWERRNMVVQIALGLLRDLGYEDLSLDRPSAGGSQV